MNPKDSSPRPTPYDLVFGGALEVGAFPRIREEAAEHGLDPADPNRFGFLTLAGDAVREMVDPDAPAEALEQYRILVFQAYNFWVHGKAVYEIEAPLARYLVEAAPGLGDWSLRLPAASFYLRLPRNLFWARLDEGSTPEPIDGFFITHSRVAEADPLAGNLELLAAVGMRPGRAGFGVIRIPEAFTRESVGLWVAAPGRTEGVDFANILPGGEIDGLYSILTTAEALKLVARVTWYIDRFPHDVVDDGAGVHRVRLGGDIAEDERVDRQPPDGG